MICTCECWIFKDKAFPASDESIGDIESSTEIVWIRGKELRADTEKDGHPHLFDEGVEAADICQGALGDCWLMSALACLTEFPGTIENIFVQREYNPRGRYSLKLYDIENSRWVTIHVDDLIPCDVSTKKPVFASPNGDELWVLLVEKAVAKFCGSYAGIEGGLVAWALQTLTGNAVLMYDLQDDNNWERTELVCEPTEKNKRRCLMRSKSPPVMFSPDQFFDLLASYDSQGCMLSASSHGEDKTRTEGRGNNDSGIVPGHAYTIISAYKSKVNRDIKLLRLRNPWGTFEWEGAWGDDSEEWKKHPVVTTEIKLMVGGVGAEDDGCFWMHFDDFVKHFDGVNVGLTHLGMNDIKLGVHEECGKAGPALGCMGGFLSFTLGCQGLKKLYCTRDGTVQGERTMPQRASHGIRNGTNLPLYLLHRCL